VALPPVPEQDVEALDVTWGRGRNPAVDAQGPRAARHRGERSAHGTYLIRRTSPPWIRFAELALTLSSLLAFFLFFDAVLVAMR
jgi:hypothetical protein